MQFLAGQWSLGPQSALHWLFFRNYPQFFALWGILGAAYKMAIDLYQCDQLRKQEQMALSYGVVCYVVGDYHMCPSCLPRYLGTCYTSQSPSSPHFFPYPKLHSAHELPSLRLAIHSPYNPAILAMICLSSPPPSLFSLFSIPFYSPVSYSYPRPCHLLALFSLVLSLSVLDSSRCL